jgi:hypothetical protein
MTISSLKVSKVFINNLCRWDKHESLFETQFGDMILAKLLDIIVILPVAIQDVLCEQLTSATGEEEDMAMDDTTVINEIQGEYPSNQEIQQFQYLLDGIQRFISMRLRNKPTPDTTPNRDHAVISATKCLSAFCKYIKTSSLVHGRGIADPFYRSTE